MREEESNWFNRWEEDLPRPEELMPISQSLITPSLALAFDINADPNTPPPSSSYLDRRHDAETAEETARTLKRPRLVWTPPLHKRFVDAVAHLGIKNAVPKTIMQLMNVEGLTRENVASHLQKYRLYLKRMQGHSSSPPSAISSADDRLFASTPLPRHFSSHQFHLAQQHHYLQQQRHVVGAAAFEHGFFSRPAPSTTITPAESAQPERRMLALFPNAED